MMAIFILNLGNAQEKNYLANNKLNFQEKLLTDEGIEE